MNVKGAATKEPSSRAESVLGPGNWDIEPSTTRVAIICTANLCRSPMAAALLSRRLAALDIHVPVRSAGLLCEGEPALPEVMPVMASYGIDLASHRSRVLTAEDLAGAALVLGMAREHLRHAAVLLPSAWPRSFTLKELVRRGEQIGPRLPGETLAEWLSRAHCGRAREALLGTSAEDDVSDPTGGPPGGYAATAAVLDELATRLTELCWAHARSCH